MPFALVVALWPAIDRGPGSARPKQYEHSGAQAGRGAPVGRRVPGDLRLIPQWVTTAQKRLKLCSGYVKEQAERKLNQAQGGARAFHPVLIPSRMLPVRTHSAPPPPSLVNAGPRVPLRQLPRHCVQEGLERIKGGTTGPAHHRRWSSTNFDPGIRNYRVVPGRELPESSRIERLTRDFPQTVLAILAHVRLRSRLPCCMARSML